MSLSDLEFSDLILTEGDTSSCFLKGTPESGLALAAVESDLYYEINELLELLKHTYEDKSSTLSLRVKFREMVFRVGMYQDIQRGRVFFLRRLPKSIPPFERLGMPKPVADWLMKPDTSKGLMLFSGPQASGKSTSASALIATRLRLYGGHAITYEHPVEMPLAGRHGEHGYCYQREITSEQELPAHIEQSHRYGSPDIIFIGEIRTKHAASEVLRIALGSNQQLVVATIHGITLSAALDRLLTWARELDGLIAHHNLSQVLLGCVHQELVFQATAPGRKLHVKEFLLLPFDESSISVRSKLREGNLNLDDNIREQRNKAIYEREV